MEKRDSFIFYRSFFEAVSNLNKRDQTTVLLALCDYALNGVEPELSGVPSSMFLLIRPNLDANQRRYENGKRGGRRKTKDEPGPNQDAEKEEPNQNRTGTKTEPKLNQDGTETEPNKDVDVDKDKREKKRKPVRFSPPSLQEVMDYCRERGSPVDPQTFLDFYTTKGWVVGKTPMKDWRAAVRTWERREGDGRGPVQAASLSFRTEVIDGEEVVVYGA